MPSLNQFASLWCKSCSSVVHGLSSFRTDAIHDSSQPMMLASSLPPVGMQKCGNFDTRETFIIANSLLQSLCVVVAERSARDPFGSSVVKAEEVRRSLLDYANKFSGDIKKRTEGTSPGSPPSGEKPSDVVKSMLENFVSSTRNLLTELSTKIVLGDKREERVRQVFDELEKLGFWVLPKREAIARILIERVDHEKAAHCPELFALDDEEAFALHQEQCLFAPFECLNPGCGSINSVVYAANHDEECPKKLIPCRLQCGLEIPREDLSAHCLTVCAKKPVPCPFKAIGCEEPLVQGELAEHSKAWVETHLHSTFLSHQKTAALVDDQGRQLSIMQKTLLEWQKKQDAELLVMQKLVEGAEKKVKGLEAEMKKAQKDIKSAQNTKEVNQLKQDISSLRQDISALQKDPPRPPAAG